MIDENFVRFIVIPDTHMIICGSRCGRLPNQGTIFAADATAFLFLDNNKKGEIRIRSFLCTMSKEDWLKH